MESVRDEVTLGDIEEHSKRHGRKATSQLLSILGKKQPLYDMVMSKGGQTLFITVIERLDELLEKIVGMEATEHEVIEYNVNVKFLKSNATLLTNYKKFSDKLKGTK